MMKLLKFPFGPALIIAVVPYTFWVYFSGTFSIGQAHRAAAIAMVATLGLTLLLRVVLGSMVRAGCVVALLVAGVVYIGNGEGSAIPIFAVVALVLLLERFQSDGKSMIALNVLGAVMLVSTLEPIVAIMLERRSVIPTENQPLGDVVLNQKPSIIHIVLDGYGAPDVLSEIYGHDTGPFISALEKRGFVVMDDVVTPFSQTLQTMASIMSGDTVDLVNTAGSVNRVRRELGNTVINGPVIETLRRAGYNLAWSESGYHFLDLDDGVEIAKVSSWITSFEANLLQRVFGIQGLHGKLHSKRVRATLAPGTISGLQQPFFYYQHLIAPHPPFSINADGSDRPSTSLSYVDAKGYVRRNGLLRKEYIEGYREKASFVEAALVSQIDAFPEGPKVVIIHGDHGPGAFFDHDVPEESCMSERMRTFVAIYSDVPELNAMFHAQQHHPFFLANLYRLIFSGLSERKLDMLPERSRHLRWFNLSDQTPVTRGDMKKSCGNGSDDAAEEFSLVR
jgi:hypothetical protein